MPDNDASFTLDPDVLAKRRAASARRVHTILIPAIRGAGFVILCVIALLQRPAAGGSAYEPGLGALVGLNIGYALISWLVLRATHGRSRLVDVSFVFLHVDLLVWLVNLRYLEQSHLFFAYFLLVRVSDQAGFGFKRAIYFNHVVVLTYIAYSMWVQHIDPAHARMGDRLSIALVMYLLGNYFAFTSSVSERLRNRLRQAVRTARELVDRLENKTSALQSQALELEQARQLAEQANVAKSQFLAVISHEVRTPMNGILGTTELLMGTPLSTQQRRYAETAHRSATALLALIDDVLDLSRIEAGKLTLHPSDIDLRALVAEAVDLMAATARDKPVSLTHRVAEEVPARLRGDPLRLRQLLVNLLHNAVKFTDLGHVRVAVTVLDAALDDVMLRFEVRDTGIGIPPDQLDSVFDAFTQVDASSTRRHGGSGLGLAIVKEISQLMGGEVSVLSRPGKGSVFRFDVRLARTERLRDGADAAGGRAVAPAAPEIPAPAPTPGLVPTHVLLAEDDEVNQMVIEAMLAKLGCTVDVVRDGASARAAAAHAAYDLIFMDCHMPVMDGYDATRRIRDDERARGSHTPVIALTADTLVADRERCLAAGMDDHLTKPVNAATLAAALRRWHARPSQNQPLVE